MSSAVGGSRIRLRPRQGTTHISRGRTVLAMSEQGTIHPDVAREGLYVYQTRVLSRYRWTMNGKEPHISVQSPIEQHSWLAYYYQAPPSCKDTPAAECDPLQEAIGLRIARVVGEGMHEDIEVTNHTQVTASITLALQADADFVAHAEAKDGRKQFGKLQKRWEKVGNSEWCWSFDYHCQHHYDHQGDRGVAQIHRGITLRLRSDSKPAHAGTRISFKFDLNPHQSWKACLIWQPQVDGKPLPVENRCNALIDAKVERARKTQTFLRQATSFRSPASDDLTPLVQRVLDRSRLDLASLRMFDLDEGDHNWKVAAGVPSYMALFGRDMLAASWQACLLSTDMSWGALSELAKTQAHAIDDWRDAQPGRILHESHSDPLSALNFKPQAMYYGSANTGFLYPCERAVALDGRQATAAALHQSCA